MEVVVFLIAHDPFKEAVVPFFLLHLPIFLDTLQLGILVSFLTSQYILPYFTWSTTKLHLDKFQCLSYFAAFL